MSTTADGTAQDHHDDPAATPSPEDLVQQVNRLLATLRGRVEELFVQFDLGGMELRDNVESQQRVAENAWLAARPHLSDAVSEVAHGTAVLHPLQHVVADLRDAIGAVEAALRRG